WVTSRILPLPPRRTTTSQPAVPRPGDGSGDRNAKRTRAEEERMATAREKMQQASEKLAQNATLAKQIGAVYKFVLEGDGGGTWTMDLRDTPKVVEGDGAAQCIITMNAGDYVDMMEGRVQGQQLFFMGKLRIDGDM